MKIIIRQILKEENLKSELRRMVKLDGWQSTYPLIGDPETLAEFAYDNDPMQFIDSLGLEKHNGKISIYFSNYEGSMFLDVFLDLNKIEVKKELSEFLLDGFKLDLNEAKNVIKNWLFDRHGIEMEPRYRIFL